MRLINTETLGLEEFVGEIPRYAILSHTWGNQEIGFQQMQRHKIDPTFPHDSTGFRKIMEFCELAKKNGFPYAWVDTCCIDKSSSAELQEAINSMFDWYYEAGICYAYLSDVAATKVENGGPFPQSRWFTRGWTLQELIAPSKLDFFNKDWVLLGSRNQHANLIETATGIRRQCLVYGHSSNFLTKFTVGEKMSWAAGRKTTRVEDQAYCLLGLFGVNMPMLYGERERAFQRLQEAIIQTSNDTSILAWGLGSSLPPYGAGALPALAPTPRHFRGCGQLVIHQPSPRPILFSRVQIGLQLAMPILTLPMYPYGTEEIDYGILNCAPTGSSWRVESVVAIPLIKTGTKGVYYRGAWSTPVLLPVELSLRAAWTEFYIDANHLLDTPAVEDYWRRYRLVIPRWDRRPPSQDFQPILKYVHGSRLLTPPDPGSIHGIAPGPDFLSAILGETSDTMRVDSSSGMQHLVHVGEPSPEIGDDNSPGPAVAFLPFAVLHVDLRLDGRELWICLSVCRRTGNLEAAAEETHSSEAEDPSFSPVLKAMRILGGQVAASASTSRTRGREVIAIQRIVPTSRHWAFQFVVEGYQPLELSLAH